MPKRAPLLSADTNGAPLELAPGSTAATTGGYRALVASAMSGVSAFGASLIAAATAGAAKALLALTKSDVGLSNVDNTSDANKPVSTAQATADGLRVLKAGDTMTGTLVVGSGGSLQLTGGDASGEGNVQMGAAASAAYDSNVLYVDANTRTMGMICSATPTFAAANGPYFALRGVTYSATAGQRGLLSVSAGNPSAPTGNEGCIVFITGADQARLRILTGGQIGIGGITPTSKLQIGGTHTAPSAGDPSMLRVTGTVVPTTNGDAYATLIDPTITKAAGGTHAYVTSLYVKQPTLSGGGAAVTNAAALFVENAPSGASNNYALLINSGASRLNGSLQLGGSGTALTQVRVYTPTLTPAAVGAAGLSVQTFTVTGLATSDTVLVNGPAAATDTALVHARVSATDTLELTWRCEAAATPAAGVYRVVAVRS